MLASNSLFRQNIGRILEKTSKRPCSSCNDTMYRLNPFAQHLVHDAGRLGTTRIAHDPGRHTGYRDIVRNRLQNHRTGCNFRAMTDFDIAENFRASTDQHTVTDFRMTVAARFARAAECDTVKNRNIVFDQRCFADHKSGRMIKEKAAAEF